MYICIYLYLQHMYVYSCTCVVLYNLVCTVHEWIFNSLLHHMPTGIHISMMSNGRVEFRSWWARAYTCKRMKSLEHMCPGWMVAFSIACKSRHTSKLSRYGMLSLGVAKAAAGPILWFSQNPFGPETWYPQPRENSHLAKAVNAMYSSHKKVTGARKNEDSSFLPWYMSYSIEAGIICQGILPSRCCGHPQLPQPSSVFRSPWHCYSRPLWRLRDFAWPWHCKPFEMSTAIHVCVVLHSWSKHWAQPMLQTQQWTSNWMWFLRPILFYYWLGHWSDYSFCKNSMYRTKVLPSAKATESPRRRIPTRKCARSAKAWSLTEVETVWPPLCPHTTKYTHLSMHVSAHLYWLHCVCVCMCAYVVNIYMYEYMNI